MAVRAELCTRPDICHGGALMAFADTVGAAAAMVNLAEGYGTTTLESKTNFLSGATLGAKLIAEATPIHRGRSTHVWQTRITAEGGKLADRDPDADGAGATRLTAGTRPQRFPERTRKEPA